VDGAGTVETVRAAAQDDGIAGFETDACGIRPHIRAALIDHADDADGRRHALDAQAVGPRPVGQHMAERIGQIGDLLEANGHGLDAFPVQPQAVAQGGLPLIGREVTEIGGDDLGAAAAQGHGRAPQSRLTLGMGGTGEHPCRVPRREGRGAQFGGGGIEFDIHRRACMAKVEFTRSSAPAGPSRQWVAGARLRPVGGRALPPHATRQHSRLS